MADYGVYWPFFSNKVEIWPVDGWRIGSGSRLADVSPGDRLWLFTSGKRCKKRLRTLGLDTEGIVDQLAYLTQILTVENVEPDPTPWSELLINGRQSCSPMVQPPFLIDDIVRPEGWDQTVSIGTLRQAPWMFPDNTTDLLKEMLRRKRPDAFKSLYGR